MNKQVFISYSHSDSAFVDNLCMQLDKLGVTYFRDQKDISWGQAIHRSVHAALDECIAVIVVLSPGSEKSQWVSYEIGHAAGADKKLLPLLTHPAMTLPGYLSELRYVTSLDHVLQYF